MEIFLWIWPLVNQTNHHQKTQQTKQSHVTNKYYGPNPQKNQNLCNLTTGQLNSAEELPAFFPHAWQIIPYSSQRIRADLLLFYSRPNKDPP